MFWLAYFVLQLVYLLFWMAYILIGIAYLISLLFGMVYFLPEMEHLIFGTHYLVISSQKYQDFHLYVVSINFAQSSPFRVPCGKKYAGLKKVRQRR